MKLSFLVGRNRINPEQPPLDATNNGGEDPIFLEQFKALRAKFEYMVDTHNHKIVAVTSAIAGEGKTLTSYNLASNLALAGRKKVLLIDIDLRKSDLSRRFGIMPIPGLSEFISGSVGLDNIIRNPRLSGLKMIPTGKRIETPSDLLAGEKFRSFLMEFKKGSASSYFDVVILDAPPLIPVSDTLSIRDVVDSFIVVYRTGFTPYTMLQQVVEELGREKILGVVLNGIEPQTHRYYKRFYGKYYHHGASK